jgi:hypothetical protein
MNKIFLILINIIILLLIYEIIHGYIRQKNRQYYYDLALQKSKLLNRKLIVYGDPYNGKGSKIYKSN